MVFRLNLNKNDFEKSFICKTKKVASNDDFSFLVAGEPQISNFLEGYEMVVDLWKYLNSRHE